MFSSKNIFGKKQQLSFAIKNIELLSYTVNIYSTSDELVFESLMWNVYIEVSDFWLHALSKKYYLKLIKSFKVNKRFSEYALQTDCQETEISPETLKEIIVVFYQASCLS